MQISSLFQRGLIGLEENLYWLEHFLLIRSVFFSSYNHDIMIRPNKTNSSFLILPNIQPKLKFSESLKCYL